jgi:KUP system potassium uptake protein
MGDGVLTPAVSVLSAVEGLEVVFPDMKPSVVPITISIILVLFLSQSYGTSKVAKYFAPFIFVWLFTISAIGAFNISKNLEVLRAISPYYAYNYFKIRGLEGWESLGGILLSISGVEALFADLGHFNRKSIKLSATFIVYPSLILTYAGQAAILAENPTLVSNAFWETVPKSIYYFVLVIATFAATIASQAMISAAFSIIHQAMSLGCFPKVYVVHTSRKHIGQVYIPEISLTLMVLSITLVATFRESASLTAAYGLASCILMLLTTCLFSLVMAIVWKKSIYTISIFLIFFGSIDIAFLSSTLLKTFSGGWIPLALAIIFSCIMNLWKWGSELKYNYLKEAQVSLESLLIDPKFSTPLPEVPGPYPTDCELNDEKSIDWLIHNGETPTPVVRVPGIGLYYSEAETDVPAVFTHTLNCFNSVPKICVFVTIRYVVVPTVLPEERFLISRLSINGFYRCVARYGYMDFIEEGKEFSQMMVDSIINYCKTMNDFLKDRQNSTSLGATSNKRLTTSISSNISENEREIEFLVESTKDNITYIMGKNLCLPKIDSPWYRKFAIGYGYKFLSNNDRSFGLRTPVAKTIQVGMKMRL